MQFLLFEAWECRDCVMALRGQMLANAVHNACAFARRGRIVLHVAPVNAGRMYLLFEVAFTGSLAFARG
jgi:hypothetical protein